jgi:hypothetical protein
VLETVELGRTDERVSALALGAMLMGWLMRQQDPRVIPLIGPRTFGQPDSTTPVPHCSDSVDRGRCGYSTRPDW